MELSKAFISLLALINPLGAIPAFLALTAHLDKRESAQAIRTAAIATALVIAVSALGGEGLLGFLGISISALQVGGGILLFLVAVGMFNAQLGPSRSTPEEESEASARSSIAVVPLTIPLLTGPGTVSTVIIYAGKAAHWTDRLWFIVIGAGIGILVWAFFQTRPSDQPPRGQDRSQHHDPPDGPAARRTGGRIRRRRGPHPVRHLKTQGRTRMQKIDWLYLAIAILSEVAATSALKATHGFSRLLPSLLVVAGYGSAFYFLSLTLRSVPLGVAYAIWSGVGIALVSLVGWIVYRQTIDLAAGSGMAMIVGGVLVIHLFSKSHA